MSTKTLPGRGDVHEPITGRPDGSAGRRHSAVRRTARAQARAAWIRRVPFLDLFAAFVGPMERELNVRSAHLAGRAHGMFDVAAYTARINATNFALANDDGNGQDFSHADVIMVGVSRSGKTPTCLYMALQYGVFAANYPLTEDDLESGKLPARLDPHRRKLYALTIKPERLMQIRNERRPESRYSSRQQVTYELRTADALFSRYSIPVIDTTECSIEEIASRILNNTGIERRLRP